MQINSKALEGIITDISDERAQMRGTILASRSSVTSRAAVELAKHYPDAPTQSLFNVANAITSAFFTGLLKELDAYCGAENSEQVLADSLARPESNNEATLAEMVVERALWEKASYDLQTKRARDFAATEPALNK